MDSDGPQCFGRAAGMAFVEGRDKSMADHWALSDSAWRPIVKSEDAKEGPRAFIEKRKPRWQAK